MSLILHLALCPVTRGTQNPVLHSASSLFFLTLRSVSEKQEERNVAEAAAQTKRTGPEGPGRPAATKSMGFLTRFGSEPWALPESFSSPRYLLKPVIVV